MARAQVTKAGAVLAATALAWLAASHFSHESATLELLLHQQQQTLQLLQLLGARDSGGSPAATEADAPSPTPVAPSSTPVAAAPGAATDACLSASLPGLSLPAENADRTFAYSSAGSGTTRHCGGTYTYEQLNGLFEPFCVDWVILGRERGYWSVTGNVRDYVDTDKIHDVEMASVKVPEEAKVPFYQSGKIDIDDFEHQIREAGATVPPTEATVLDFGCGLARLSSELSKRFQHVICVDQSHVHLELAKSEYNKMRAGDCDSARSMADVPKTHTATFLLTGPNLLARMQGKKVDMVVTAISLQHTLPPLQLAYVEQLCDVLTPGGVAFIHIPNRIPTYETTLKTKPGSSECDFDEYHANPDLRGEMQIHAIDHELMLTRMKARGCELMGAKVCDKAAIAGGLEHCYVFKRSS